MGLRHTAALLAMLATVPAASSAQTTRAEAAREQRAAKAAGPLEPYRPKKAEAVLYRIEDDRLMERIFNPPRGVFVRYGGLPQGAGLGAGPAWRHSTAHWSLTGSSAFSIRGYREVDGVFSFPQLAGERAFVNVGARHRYFPQEDFFGLGRESLDEEQTSFTLREWSGRVEAGVEAADWFTISALSAWERPRISRGTDKRFPSTQDLFDDARAPGLSAQPDFRRHGVAAVLDFTDRPLGPPVGGRYALTYDRYVDLDLDRHSFHQWAVDLRQHVPIVPGSRTIVLRAFLTGVRPDTGHDVPFYLQPTLGGPYSLRDLPAYRLRDRNLMLLQAEYRFELNAFMTGAVFYDAGKVAFRPRDLDFSNLRHDAGFGLRFGFMSAVSLRTEVAFGRDGARLVFKFNDVF